MTFLVDETDSLVHKVN